MAQPRKIAEFEVSPVSLGCMNLSHAYGAPTSEEAGIKLLNEALDMGYTHLDTAALYGFGNNESLLGKAVMHRRDEFMLASKCGMFKNDQGVREIDGRPETIKKTCDDALKRLNSDVIDLYYLHRWDKKVPIEESVGAMSDLVDAGKILTLGLSEVSSKTLEKAHAVHPIAALQTEYSLWSRNAEISVLETCRKLGVAFVAFSPVGRQFLTGTLSMKDVENFAEKDIRRAMPRFSAENYPKNLELLDGLKAYSEKYDCNLAQLSIAWGLAKGDDIISIPGTTSLKHLQENFAAGDIKLDPEDVNAIGNVINQDNVVGDRYPALGQSEVDTEKFPGELAA